MAKLYCARGGLRDEDLRPLDGASCLARERRDAELLFHAADMDEDDAEAWVLEYAMRLDLMSSGWTGAMSWEGLGTRREAVKAFAEMIEDGEPQATDDGERLRGGRGGRELVLEARLWLRMPAEEGGGWDLAGSMGVCRAESN